MTSHAAARALSYHAVPRTWPRGGPTLSGRFRSLDLAQENHLQVLGSQVLAKPVCVSVDSRVVNESRDLTADGGKATPLSLSATRHRGAATGSIPAKDPYRPRVQLIHE